MKKNIIISILAIFCAIFLPLNYVSAASGTIFAASSQTLAASTTTENGNSVAIKNQDGTAKIYLGANVTSGTMTEYKAKLTLENSNFVYKSFSKESGWSGTIEADDDGNINIDLKNATGITGKALVATINLTVSSSADATETCSIALSTVSEPTSTPTPTETPNPKCQTVNGKYYDANGNEVSQEAYKQSCNQQENPQTGNFLPYTIILIGVMIAAGLYFVTKKNNKIYHV